MLQISFYCFKENIFFIYYLSFSDNKSGISNGQAFSTDKSLWPDTSEVTQLLDNHFTILQHLEGQVEFYKVC